MQSSLGCSWVVWTLADSSQAHAQCHEAALAGCPDCATEAAPGALSGTLSCLLSAGAWPSLRAPAFLICLLVYCRSLGGVFALAVGQVNKDSIWLVSVPDVLEIMPAHSRALLFTCCENE